MIDILSQSQLFKRNRVLHVNITLSGMFVPAGVENKVDCGDARNVLDGVDGC